MVTLRGVSSFWVAATVVVMWSTLAVVPLGLCRFHWERCAGIVISVVDESSATNGVTVAGSLGGGIAEP